MLFILLLQDRGLPVPEPLYEGPSGFVPKSEVIVKNLLSHIFLKMKHDLKMFNLRELNYLKSFPNIFCFFLANLQKSKIYSSLFCTRIKMFFILFLHKPKKKQNAIQFQIKLASNHLLRRFNFITERC